MKLVDKDILSQEEIDILLKETEDLDRDSSDDEVISEIEKDTLGKLKYNYGDCCNNLINFVK